MLIFQGVGRGLTGGLGRGVGKGLTCPAEANPLSAEMASSSTTFKLRSTSG